MIINFYNHSCFKIQSGDFTLAFDPPSKESGYKTPKFQADVIFISHNNKNHNGKDALALKEESDRFIVHSPGEYEIKDIIIKGVQTKSVSEDEKNFLINSAYILNFEDMKICHMGDFSENELRPELSEAIGKSDILFFPVSSGPLDAKTAASIAKELEPSVIIPMHYDGGKKDNKKLSDFLNEFSLEQIEKSDKLTIKKKDLNENELKVVVLEPNL